MAAKRQKNIACFFLSGLGKRRCVGADQLQMHRNLNPRAFIAFPRTYGKHAISTRCDHWKEEITGKAGVLSPIDE